MVHEDIMVCNFFFLQYQYIIIELVQIPLILITQMKTMFCISLPLIQLPTTPLRMILIVDKQGFWLLTKGIIEPVKLIELRTSETRYIHFDHYGFWKANNPNLWLSLCLPFSLIPSSPLLSPISFVKIRQSQQPQASWHS